MDQLRRHRSLALADPVERVLEMVQETGERGEAEHRARTLERMQRAEHRVDLFGISRIGLELEQRAVETLEDLAWLPG